MFYETRLTIPPNTAQSIPVTDTMPIHPGILRRFEVTFPPGPAGLAHLQVYLWGHQLFPSNPNSDFSGDDVQIVWDEDLEIIDPPFEFTLTGWSDDDTYPHIVTVRAAIIPFERDLRTLLTAAISQGQGTIIYEGSA